MRCGALFYSQSIDMGTPSERLKLDEVYAFVDDDVIMLKTQNEFGDPAELTEQNALELSSWLRQWALKLDPDAEK